MFKSFHEVAIEIAIIPSDLNRVSTNFSVFFTGSIVAADCSVGLFEKANKSDLDPKNIQIKAVVA